MHFPVIELLKGYFGIEAWDDTRKIQEKVTGKTLSLDRTLAGAGRPLLEGVPVAYGSSGAPGA